MNKDQFWQIIESVNLARPMGDQETIRTRTIEELIHHSVDDILDFHMIQQEYFIQAYRNDLRAASEALGADSTDEGFKAFRFWLISRGKDVYMSAMKDPDTLADVPKEGEMLEFSPYAYTAFIAYSIKMDILKPGDMSDIYGALLTKNGGILDEKCRKEIEEELPVHEDIGNRCSLNMIKELFPHIYERNADRLLQTGLLQDAVDRLIDSDNAVHAYVCSNLGIDEFVFEGSPSNIANFIGGHSMAHWIVFTDTAGNNILDTRGSFISGCTDPSLLEEVKRTLIPIQMGEIKEKPVSCIDGYDFMRLTPPEDMRLT